MKIPYTYALLRYFHDPVTGEFANVGVVLYSPKAGFLQSRVLTRYRRLSCFFGRNIEGSHFRGLVRHIGDRIDALGGRLSEELDFGEFADAKALVDRVLPPDDSAFQFSEVRGGLSADLEVTIEELFARYVTRYAEDRERPSDQPARGRRLRIEYRNLGC